MLQSQCEYIDNYLSQNEVFLILFIFNLSVKQSSEMKSYL